MIDSHDDSHDESSDASPVRAKDEGPTEAHGVDAEQEGGSGAGPEGEDKKDTHTPDAPEAQDDE